jgi:predicted regulator of Ras-like GTPase activity (Roadblock/LC7/MglB family)
MVITGASSETLLVVLCKYNVNLGMLFIQAEKSVSKIREILE